MTNANGEYTLKPRTRKLKPASKVKYTIQNKADVIPVKVKERKARAVKHNFPFDSLEIEEGFILTETADMNFKRIYDLARSYATQKGRSLGKKFRCETIEKGAKAFIWREK